MQRSKHDQRPKWTLALVVCLGAAVLGFAGLNRGWRQNTAAAQSQAAQPAANPQPAAAGESAEVLYIRHCAACHGKRGDGLGRAARHVFPKPRNFRKGRFRFVTTANRVASRSNIVAVVDDGIPGTSMPAFKKLPAATRSRIVNHVVKLWKDGTREAITRHLLENEDELLPQQVDRLVLRKTSGGKSLVIPSFEPASGAELKRGEAIYRRQSCQSCHGANGRGDLGQDLSNDNGFPTRVRDFVTDELKSGSDAGKMFAVIRLGMPGTPMPSSRTLSDRDLQALAAYCLSLGKTPKRKLTNHQRAMLAIGKRPEEVGATQPPARRE